MRHLSSAGILIGAMIAAGAAHADGIQQYGDANCLTTGCYGATDPTTGATLIGLAPGATTLASQSFAHSWPFTPDVGDFPGTDQIYVGSTQTGADDGYSTSSQRIAGPDVLTLDYSALVPGGSTITSLTLGIAADDFQFPVFGNPFIVTVNGTPDAALTTLLESLQETGPVVQFATIGIDPSTLLSSNVLTLSIDEGGNGGDGYAVDFLTVGVVTGAAAPAGVPEPTALALLGAGLAGLPFARRRKAI